MSTAALSAPHLEITAPDTMDLYSDTGLDFGDDDIDLDLRSTGGLDEDVTFRDAATDASQDVQTVLGDQDDFMADNEDLIEEDDVDEDVEVLAQPGQADLEEDLIDYSDEEDVVVEDTPVDADAPQDDSRHSAVTGGDNQDNPALEDTSYPGEHAREDETVSQHAPDTHVYGEQASLHEHDSYPAQQPSDQPGSQEQDQVQNDAHVQPEISVNDVQSLERRTSDPVIDNPTATGTENATTEQSGQDLQEDNFHPINIHFDGRDYWLFKHHDYEGTGDYLLENDAFFKQPIHTVINACREALRTLGADVSSDLELGFCLDSLHSVELYEEHPTCHFFNLNDILRVYLQLYAQDGITDPEYFCITLISRPRISSLLAELSKAATEGIGYSGLNDAIASGQTAFSAHYSHSSPEQGHEEWEEGDEQEASEAQSGFQGGEQDDHESNHQEDDEHEGLTGLDSDDKTVKEAQEKLKPDQLAAAAFDLGDERETWRQIEREEKEEHVEEEHNEEHHEEHDEQASGNAADNPEGRVPAAVTASNDVITKDATATVDEHVEQSISHTVTSDQELQDSEEDLLDYSDDEYNEAPENEAQATQDSSDSATVQGDDPPQAQVNSEAVAQDGQAGGQAGETGEVTLDGQVGLSDETFAGYEGHEDSYGEFDGQAYGEEYDGEYGQDYNEGQEFEGYPAYDASQANDENTNYLGDPGQQLADHADDTQVNSGLNHDEPDAVDDTYEGSNDLLNSDDAAAAAQRVENEHAAEDEIDYSDEEDGAVSQAPVAASAAADTVATSSSGLQNLSPQGQKRTLDEVGNDVVDATNSTDAKRLRV